MRIVFERIFTPTLKIVTGLLYNRGLSIRWHVIYIVNTIQYVKKRIYDHQNGIAKGNPDYSAFVKLGLENPLHDIDFGGVRVIDRETRQKRREVLEMLHIAENIDSCMNTTTDSMYVLNCYRSFWVHKDIFVLYYFCLLLRFVWFFDSHRSDLWFFTWQKKIWGQRKSCKKKKKFREFW
jgi:hypothetical protein